MYRRLALTFAFAVSAAACATAPPKEAEAPKPEPQASPAVVDAPLKKEEPAPQKVLVALKRVHFARGNAKLNAVSKAALDEAAKTLKKNTDLELEIEGHADERGSDSYNQNLGEDRARAVQQYLTHAGIEQSRMSITSRGESSPLDSGETKAALASNRRVEFRIVRGNAELEVKAGVVIDDRGRPMGLRRARHTK